MTQQIKELAMEAWLPTFNPQKPEKAEGENDPSTKLFPNFHKRILGFFFFIKRMEGTTEQRKNRLCN